MAVLYLCATPIGNLEDVSLRLLKTLRQADIIACEDTRHSQRLLNHYEIKKPLLSYHQHSPEQREDHIIRLLREGQSVALLSDAGMPLISDPGAALVQKALAAGIDVDVIPGPSAGITALCLSGLSSDRFLFMGFLPRRRKERRAELESIKDSPVSVIIYEAPHRLLACLEDIETVLGPERPLVLARELTKLHQEVLRESAGQLRRRYALTPPKGEICLIIGPAEPTPPPSVDVDTVLAEAAPRIAAGEKKQEVFRELAAQYRLSRSELYNEWERRH
ncbi:MAG: 16S rRNA (cytidine(1402)-2'-O)-methyltransferase [Syntrophomonadaceae bacterium]|nr:16S rRNA (cytidine(1402)-2'-O)-methyltransferase [Syntrophomonadaceae bacterium]